MLTLIEKAQSETDEKEAMKLAKRLEENKFDLNDLLEQMRAIQRMGPLKQVIGMLPGIGSQIKDEQLDQGEVQLRRIESMIQSMTKEEKAKPAIINPSRKRRIAAGSGTKVEDVNRLLRQFEQMQKMMKQLGGKKGKGKRRRMPMPPMMSGK